MGRRARRRAKEKADLPTVRSQDTDQSLSVEQRRTWQGPLPPPEALQAFREAVPRSDEVILSEYEKQGEHRRDLETRESKANAFAVRALSTGTVLTSLGTIGGGIYLAVLGHIWGAAIVIAGPLVTVVLGRSKSREG